MCHPAVAMGLMAVAGGVTAYAQMQQGRAQKSYYNYLAGQARLEGAAALAMAQKQAELTQESASIENKSLALKGAEASASQKAAMAASGLDLSSVTAQDITLDTLTKAKMDEMMIRRNANLQAASQLDEGKYANWSAESQAQQYGYAGKQAKKAGNIGAFTTLLGTAASMGMAANSFGMFAPKTAAATSSLPSGFSWKPMTGSTPSSPWGSAYGVAKPRYVNVNFG